MQIRFTKFTPAGNVQVQPGEMLDLPASIAEAHVADGNAVAVPKAETAALHYESARAYPVTRFKPRKATPRR